MKAGLLLFILLRVTRCVRSDHSCCGVLWLASGTARSIQRMHRPKLFHTFQLSSYIHKSYIYMHIFFLEALIAWFLFPEQLMPWSKHKKKALYNTFIINDTIGNFKNIAPHFV